LDLLHFITHRLSALSEAFAAGPLMQMRVSTPGASVTLTKARVDRLMPHAEEHADHTDRRHAGRPAHGYLTEGEAGRAYDTVSADVVGVFHSAPDLPAPGDGVEPDRVLGDIEALKLRTPVVAGFAGRFVGQVAEDGQAVDFGETLFVIDSGAAQASAEAPAEEQPVVMEPPRI
jgi:biotin carboxyl carrier protein